MSDVVSLRFAVERAVASALSRVLPPAPAGSDPLVRRSEFADFQSNAALSAAKQAGTNPRALAAALAEAVAGTGLTAEVSGPGFLNITVADAAVWDRVDLLAGDERLGVGAPEAGRRIVIDYSAPNVAKEMHVGHLRGTILGDALARVHAHLGAEVLRRNHLGDWGTQFGMLIQYLIEHPEADWHTGADTDPAASVAALGPLYRQANAVFKADPEFAVRARARVVALQGGDPETLRVWRELVAVSTVAFQSVYDRLGVLLTPEDVVGESFYNPLLDDVVAELTEKGILRESDGALCVFFDDVTGPGGDPVPLIVRKSDGGYGYAATDLATIRHRVRDLKADTVLYVIDVRQALHLRMVFETARRAGWLTDGVTAEHMSYGTVLGRDGRPLKTRDGHTVRLVELLDAADAKAAAVLAERTHDLSPEMLAEVVAAAGIGSVKYADLSTSRTRDYTFDLDRMVSLHGNTAVYLQYAYARVRSILAKAPADASAAIADASAPMHPAERALALRLDEYADVLTDVAALGEPHRLCAYLYELATAFSGFFESCPVLRAGTGAQRSNRLALTRLTGDVLAQGLRLLGLRTPERM